MYTDGRTRTISREVLQQAAGDLRRLAEKRKPKETIPPILTHPQVIKVLRPEIAAVFKQGYEVADIIALLSQQGINIEATTFRTYWRRAQQVRGRSATTKSRPNPDGARSAGSKPVATPRREHALSAKNVEPANETEHPA